MYSATMEDIKKQAVLLARENKRADPDIQRFYWIPSLTEVRLIEVESTTVKSLSGEVEPFYFDPAPTDGLPSPSGVALIRPDEIGKLTLPAEWGSWEDAKILEIDA